MEKQKMKLTIFTPTYNRSDKLFKIYDSLIKQKSNDIEWIIIDDGSIDGTKGVVEKIKSLDNPFDIIYVYQENSGKHRAYNTALKLAQGEYFFCLDSDDWLNEDAVNNVIDAMTGGELIIIAYKTSEKGVLLSNEFPKDICTVSFADLQYRYKCFGEFTIIFKTSLAKRFPFPEFEGEKFVTESVVYDRMIDIQATLLPKIITICEYQSDGLSANINNTIRRNPAGYCLYYMQRIDIESSCIKRVMVASKYNCFCMFAKQKKSKYNGKYSIIVVLSKPLGWFCWLYYKIFRGF